jgi:hypothetical protein
MSYLKKITQRSYYYLKLHSAKSNTLGHILINYLILQPKCKFVLQYKELILNGETLEILEKFYKRQLSKNYLKSLFYLYTKYIKVYPNYLVIDIDNILMNNINSKQKILNYFENENEVKADCFESNILNEISKNEPFDNCYPEIYPVKQLDLYNKKHHRKRKDSNEEIENLIWIIDNALYNNKKKKNSKKQKQINCDYIDKNENNEDEKEITYKEGENNEIIIEEDDKKIKVNNQIYKSKFKSVGEFVYFQKLKENNLFNYHKEEKRIKNKIFKNILKMKKI